MSPVSVKKLLLASLFGVSLNALLAVSIAEDDSEREIAMADAPEAIRNAFAGVNVDEVSVETEGDREIYDVSLELDDYEVELELTADGRLLEVEVEHEEDDDGDDGDDADGDDPEDED